MKTTKALVLSFLFLLGAASVRAQATDRTDRPDPSERAENQAERMAIVLDLTPAQTARVREINQSFAERVKGEREEGRNQRQALQQERTAALKTVLTEEQFSKLEALQDQRKERRSDRGGEPRGKGRGQRGSGQDRN